MQDNEVTNALEEFPVLWLTSLGIDEKNAAVIGTGFGLTEIKEETLFLNLKKWRNAIRYALSELAAI